MAASDNDGGVNQKSEREEQEEALIALIEHRTKEVHHLRMRVAYYKSELDESEKRLEETQRKLARLRSRGYSLPSARSVENVLKVKEERRSASPLKISKDSFHNHAEYDSGTSSMIYLEDHPKKAKIEQKPLLVIPGMNPKIPPPLKMESGKASRELGSRPVESRATRKKRKFGENKHTDLIEMVGNSSSYGSISCYKSISFPCQHKRKLRSLVLCPTNDQLFATRSNANLLSTINGASLKQRRWPEDIAWHPRGGSLISVYSADGGDSQIAILNLDKEQITFLEDKPHVKGIINNIMFMPWDDTCFVTGGCDHAVVHWTEKHGARSSWKPKVLHKNIHSSAVMGVAGMQQKPIVVSVGADKRIVGFDLQVERADYKHQIESKCMSVLPNPRDFNLFMVQTGTPQRQLRLFDIRSKQTEIHDFGWTQESSESQSALINQCWSPDGLYLTSGSADPRIHIFDIRYNIGYASQSIRAHKKRVFKAAWHRSFPLLISISSDLQIGMHKIA